MSYKNEKIKYEFFLNEGIETIGNFTEKEIQYIKKTQKKGYSFTEKYNYTKRKREEWLNRFEIPKGKEKELKQKTKEIIDDLEKKANDNIWEEISYEWYKLLQEPWREKLKKIEALLKFNKKFNTENLENAKKYPIQNLLDFNGAGFAKCLWHEEKTGSLKLNKKTNTVYCFAGCGKKDSIDVCMIINNIPLGEAIKKLCQGN